MRLNPTHGTFNAEKPKENKTLVRQITGDFCYNGQVLMHFALKLSFKSQISCYRHLLQKLMYTEILCQAQALPKCHANANISVPLVM